MPCVYTVACSSMDCIEPGLKYPFLFTGQSFEYSNMCIVTSLVHKSSFWDIPTTPILHRISLFWRSHIDGRYFLSIYKWKDAAGQ